MERRQEEIGEERSYSLPSLFLPLLLNSYCTFAFIYFLLSCPRSFLFHFPIHLHNSLPCLLYSPFTFSSTSSYPFFHITSFLSPPYPFSAPSYPTSYPFLPFLLPHLLSLPHPSDMESIDSLAKAINQFSGGMVLVSHDMRLISQVRDSLLCAA